MAKETKRITRKRTTAPKTAKAKKKAIAVEITHEDIARRAYELFEARGGAEGLHLDDWLAAEAELRGARAA